MIVGMFGPALAIAIIGLVQGAGVSQSYPNPDSYPNVSRATSSARGGQHFRRLLPGDSSGRLHVRHGGHSECGRALSGPTSSAASLWR
ncbi:MAG: hypothetical protein R2854_18765 [Caldilineaceae bacterium]